MSVIKYVAKFYDKFFAITFLELKDESYENISMESNAKILVCSDKKKCATFILNLF